MLIAVLQYGTKKLRVGDKVAVMDTDDLTVQVVPVNDLYTTGIYKDVSNLVMHDLLNSFTFRYANISNFLPASIYSNGDLTINNGVIRLDEYKKSLIVNGVEFVTAEDIVVDWNLAYFYKFRDYTVLRFAQRYYCVDLTTEYDWYSFVIDKNNNIVANWWIDKPETELEIKIDTIMRV